MKATIKTLFFLVFIFGVAGGCTVIEKREGAAPGIQVRDSRLPYARIRMNTVNIIDKSLQNWGGDETSPSPEFITGKDPAEANKQAKIAIENTNSRRTPTGTLEVMVVVRNRTDFPLQIEGRTQFFDENEFPSDGPTAWRRIFLPPNGVGSYREFSSKARGINYYYVELRAGR